MMGSLDPRERPEAGGVAGRLSLLWKTVTFHPGSEQHFLIIVHLHVSLDIKLKRSL